MGYYESVFSKLDYRFWIIIMPLIGILLIPSALNIPLGMDFTGGTEVQILTERDVTGPQLESSLSTCATGISAIVQSIEGKNSVIIRTKQEMTKECIDSSLTTLGFTDDELKPILPTIFKPELGKILMQQGINAVIIAGIMMSAIIFIAFRSLVPSLAVMQAAFFDPMISIGILSLFGFELNLAGVAAMLMLVGYSVDTDILLTSKVLKQQGKTFAQCVNEAFPTGITMTLTTLSAMGAILVFTSYISMDTIHQIASVLFVGLIADMSTTWFTNVGLLKWYTSKHKVVKQSKFNMHLFRS